MVGLNLPPNRWMDDALRSEEKFRRTQEHQVLRTQEVRKMGYALWCDQHGGPFSPKDPEMQEYSKKKRINDTVYDDETFTLCGPCANGFQVGKPTAQAQLEAQIAVAERDLGMA